MGKFCFSFNKKNPFQLLKDWKGLNKSENNVQLQNLGNLSTIKIPIIL